MRVLPTSMTEIQIMPETETEVMFVRNFFFNWNQRSAILILKSGLRGLDPQMVLTLKPEANLIPSPFATKKTKK